jgi:secreted trypsin-like serine protease
MRIENIFVILITVFVIFACVSANPIDDCGIRINVAQGNVVGGERTMQNSWPWLVALKHRHTKKFFCGGSLVSERHVISGEVLNMIE